MTSSRSDRPLQRRTTPNVRVTVRPANVRDLDGMARVQEAAGRTSHPDAWRAALENPGRRVLVAADPVGEIVGWAQTYHHTDPEDAAPTGHYLGGVTVHPELRRRGVAVALTDARMRWIAQRADVAYYVVNPANFASIQLHRRWGFVEVLRAPQLTGVEFTGGEGILMRAPLP